MKPADTFMYATDGFGSAGVTADSKVWIIYRVSKILRMTVFAPGCVKTPNLKIFVGRVTIADTEKTVWRAF